MHKLVAISAVNSILLPLYLPQSSTFVMNNISNLLSPIRKNKFISFQPVFCSTVVVVLFTFFAIGCGENVDKIPDAQVFRYNEDVSVNTLDPVYIKSQSEMWIGSQIYEGLVALDADLKPIPQIAKYWEISDSGRVYKFVIKPNLQFIVTDTDKNGILPVRKIPLTVGDVAHSLYRLLDPKTASPGAWILNDKMDLPPGFLNQKNAGNNASDISSLSHTYQHFYKQATSPIYTPNDSTIILRINKPFPAFLSLLATNFAWVYPHNAMQLGNKPVGSGPFYLRRWESDVKMVLLKNPHYHMKYKGSALPFLEAVNVSFVKSKQTAFMQFMAGNYDFFNGVEASFIDELLTDSATLNPKYQSSIQALLTDFLNTEYIGFYLGDTLNGLPNPYKDKNLRKALQLSVDRQALLRYLRNGLGVPGGNGFVPPALLLAASPEKNNDSWTKERISIRQTAALTKGNPGAKNLESATKKGYLLDSARKYLGQSDFVRFRKKFAPLVLTTTSDYLDMAVFLQNAWKQIGLDVAIEIQTGGMLRQLRNAGKLGMFRGSWIADYPDAENYLACFYSPYKAPNGPNYTHYDSKYFDQLFEEVAFAKMENEEDVQRRNRMIHEANMLTFEDAPVIVLYYDKSVRLMQKNVSGLGNDPINRLDLRYVRKR